jgi:hypothetical protein
MLPLVDEHDRPGGVLPMDRALQLLATDVADGFLSIGAASPDEYCARLRLVRQ